MSTVFSESAYSPTRVLFAQSPAFGAGLASVRIFQTLPNVGVSHYKVGLSYRFRALPPGMGPVDLLGLYFVLANRSRYTVTVRQGREFLALTDFGVPADAGPPPTAVTLGPAQAPQLWSRVELDLDLGLDGGGSATLTRDGINQSAQLFLKDDVRDVIPSLYIGMTAIYGPSDPLSLEIDDVVVWLN